jgi:hypothetical protein
VVAVVVKDKFLVRVPLAVVLEDFFKELLLVLLQLHILLLLVPVVLVILLMEVMEATEQILHLIH